MFRDAVKHGEFPRFEFAKDLFLLLLMKIRNLTLGTLGTNKLRLYTHNQPRKLMKPLSIYLVLLEHEHAVSTGENWRKQMGHCWQEPLMATFRQHQLFLCLQLPWRSSPGGDTVGICLSIADVNVKEADLGNGDIHQPSKIWNHECGYITFIVLVGWIILRGAELCVPCVLRPEVFTFSQVPRQPTWGRDDWNGTCY